MKLIKTVFITALLTCLTLGVSGVRAADHHPHHTTNVLMESVKSVFDNYLKIQSALAQDSLEGVAATARAMAKAVRNDSMKMLPSQVADQAEALAAAKDLKAARAAFDSLSQSLIRYLAQNKMSAGQYREAYCPMAKASWLQTADAIQNPYFGKAMLKCGQFKQ